MHYSGYLNVFRSTLRLDEREGSCCRRGSGGGCGGHPDADADATVRGLLPGGGGGVVDVAAAVAAAAPRRARLRPAAVVNKVVRLNILVQYLLTSW